MIVQLHPWWKLRNPINWNFYVFQRPDESSRLPCLISDVLLNCTPSKCAGYIWNRSMAVTQLSATLLQFAHSEGIMHSTYWIWGEMVICRSLSNLQRDCRIKRIWLSWMGCGGGVRERRHFFQPSCCVVLCLVFFRIYGTLNCNIFRDCTGIWYSEQTQ